MQVASSIDIPVVTSVKPAKRKFIERKPTLNNLMNKLNNLMTIDNRPNWVERVKKEMQ